MENTGCHEAIDQFTAEVDCLSLDLYRLKRLLVSELYGVVLDEDYQLMDKLISALDTVNAI